jgi:hypothetical protein
MQNGFTVKCLTLEALGASDLTQNGTKASYNIK